jgi:hypothetical protein
MAKRHTLRDDKKPPKPKAAYTMPIPNDDIAEYGWQLKNIRHPDPKSADKKDPDPGAPIFAAPQQTLHTMKTIGHDAHFICPKYLQILFDASPELRDASIKAAEARYTKEALGRLEEEIRRVFTDVVIPDIAKNFDAIAPMIAQFYAARIAHIKKFGKQVPD